MRRGRQLQGRLWWLFNNIYCTYLSLGCMGPMGFSFISKLPITQWTVSLSRSGTIVCALILLLKYPVCLLDTNKHSTCAKREQNGEGGILLLSQDASSGAPFYILRAFKPYINRQKSGISITCFKLDVLQKLSVKLT